MPFSRQGAQIASAQIAPVDSTVVSIDLAQSERRVDLRRRASDDVLNPAMRAALDATPYVGPRLVVDLAAVDRAYDALAAGLDDVEIYYAIKANPNPAILSRLRGKGSNFDVASRGEIDRCLGLGIEAERLSFGNTIKRESDIAYAYSAGVRIFAMDSEGELEKIARAAPGAQVYCRILVSNDGADWPLSRKFGCAPDMASTLLHRAAELGLEPVGLSFHVGSQTRNPEDWRPALAEAAATWRHIAAQGLRLTVLNLGGGFPTSYADRAPEAEGYARRVRALIDEAFSGLPVWLAPERIIAEPGRGMVGESGVLEAEVLLVSRKGVEDDQRWVYLDIGKFGGLAETMDEAIRYRLVTDRDGGPKGPCVLAGPTCDSADVLYEKRPVELPLDLEPGDRILIPSTGAYTTTYGAHWFNGFEPVQELVCDSDA